MIGEKTTLTHTISRFLTFTRIFSHKNTREQTNTRNDEDEADTKVLLLSRFNTLQN